MKLDSAFMIAAHVPWVDPRLDTLPVVGSDEEVASFRLQDRRPYLCGLEGGRGAGLRGHCGSVDPT